MSSIDELRAEVKKYRELNWAVQRRDSGVSPSARALQVLNSEYGEAKRAAKAAYMAERERLLEAIAAERAVRPVRARGRAPFGPYPDSLKVAAYNLYREAGSKTLVRTMLGVTDTQKLNTLLAEGKELWKAKREEGW